MVQLSHPYVTSGKAIGEGNGNPLLYSCLENPLDGGTWQATVCGDAESDMTESLHLLPSFLDCTELCQQSGVSVF